MEASYLTEREAAAIARLSRITLWRYRRRKKVPCILLPGGHPRYPRAEFLRWLGGLKAARRR